MMPEEDRLILHDLRGVNLRVDFFFGTREDFIKDVQCISYSVCWKAVDVLVDLVTVSEQISELDFYYDRQRLFIDDHKLSGEVIGFAAELDENRILTASCVILLGKNY